MKKGSTPRRAPSTRTAAVEGQRALDDRARQRRQQRHLEDLERDNHVPDIKIDVFRLPDHPNPRASVLLRRTRTERAQTESGSALLVLACWVAAVQHKTRRNGGGSARRSRCSSPKSRSTFCSTKAYVGGTLSPA